MSKNATRHRKIGRPVTTGTHPTYTVRLSPEQIEPVNAWAAAQGLSRSEAIRQLIAEAIKRKLS